MTAVTLGYLSSPGPGRRAFQQLAAVVHLENPNALISQYPLVMIPVFAVPVFVILHILSLRQLAREEIFVTAS